MAMCGAARADTCSMVDDAIVLLHATTGNGSRLSFCIKKGVPTVITTLDADSNPIVESRYEGMKALTAHNFKTGRDISYRYSNVRGDPRDVGVGQGASWVLEARGADVPPELVTVQAVEAVTRTVGDCRFEARVLHRSSRTLAGVGRDAVIVYAPALGWSLESRITMVPSQAVKASQTTIVDEIGSRAEAEQTCRRAFQP
jgi:hypothetical protein